MSPRPKPLQQTSSSFSSSSSDDEIHTFDADAAAKEATYNDEAHEVRGNKRVPLCSATTAASRAPPNSQPARAVTADESGAIGAERAAVNKTIVPLKRRSANPRRGVPQLQELIKAA